MAFLQQDLGVAEAAVNELGVDLTGNRFAAPVSFKFNHVAATLTS